ncbi:ComF family protein [Shewanella dokdonensis]|uniref:ComF family protein n=2 Tax=Shewanella dokdonensis TaxID=712036 RepID=A0ABX8DLF4_9GAMM|nr:ComF family protein [Shewanella dokdonensis]MCL1075521.1 ComF family protein [Shewanella dokdonensis]QVK24801.1 ComF family protein [Shewanella dokdonensis]
MAGCQKFITSLPNRCLLCHQQLCSAATGICHTCLQSCLYTSPVCLGCGRELQTLQRYCGACLALQPIPVIAPASYHSLLGPLIPKIKYQAQFTALPPLVLALERRLAMLVAHNLTVLPQALLPVPLHPHRLRERGFNQAWMIASMLGQKLQLPVVDNLLRRVVATVPQTGLDGRARRRNLRDAFMLTADLPYQRIALVDDVVTTGTTVDEIARTLAPWTPDLQVWCLARAEAPGM